MDTNVIRLGTFSFKITKIRLILLAMACIGAATMLFRLIFGLGAATNLNDAWPFGLWVAVDVMLGVALAAGGFTLCAVVYVFNKKEYKPLARPAVLTAWLGYILVLIALAMDVGLWYNWWRPLIHWGYTSVLFEVFICVVAYNLVLLVEFLPVISERFNWKKIYRVTTLVALPAVLAGIVLSTLHQSSLGALFLIVPHKLHPLWYTEMLPWLFLISAVAVGPAMVTLESYLAFRSYGTRLETNLFSKLTKIIAAIALFYVVFRVWDLASLGQLGAIFEGTIYSNLFIFEMILFIIPVLLVLLGPGRNSKKGIAAVSSFVVAGVAANRINIVFAGLWQSAPLPYIPSILEFFVTLGLISMLCLVYLFVVENFKVFPMEEDNNPFRENVESGIIPENELIKTTE